MNDSFCTYHARHLSYYRFAQDISSGLRGAHLSLGAAESLECRREADTHNLFVFVAPIQPIND